MQVRCSLSPRGNLETQGNSGVPPWGSATGFGGGLMGFGGGVQEGGRGVVLSFHLRVPRGAFGGPAGV